MPTHNVDKFLDLAYSFGTNLAHLERYEQAKFITLQKEKKARKEGVSKAVCYDDSYNDTPWQLEPRESGVLSHLSLARVYF